MSTPNDPTSGEPRFGQRSENWEEQPAAQPGSTTPWPQYGQTPPAASPSPSWPQAGQQGQPGGYVPNQQGPYPPQGGGYAPQPQPQPQGERGYGYAAPSVPMPSRVGPVLTIIAGILVGTVIAFIAFFAMTFSGVNIQNMVESAAPVTSGGQVSVDQSGTYIVTAVDGAAISCTLTAEDGTVLELQGEMGQAGVAMGSQILPGTYTLTCDGDSGTNLVGMTGSSVADLTSAGVRALVVSSVIGVVGLFMIIAGVAWLVKVNKRRREIQRDQWRGGPLGA